MTVTPKQERTINMLHIWFSIAAVVLTPAITFAMNYAINGQRITELETKWVAEAIAAKERESALKAEKRELELSLRDISNRLSRIEGALGVSKQGN